MRDRQRKQTGSQRVERRRTQVGRRHEQQLRFLLARRCSLTLAVAYSTDIRRLLQLESKSLKLLALPKGIEPLFQP